MISIKIVCQKVDIATPFWQIRGTVIVMNFASFNCMTTALQIIECMSPECRRVFQIAASEFLDTSWKRGVIRCPHCGATMIGPSDSVFLSYGITAKEEERSKRKKYGGKST